MKYLAKFFVFALIIGVCFSAYPHYTYGWTFNEEIERVKENLPTHTSHGLKPCKHQRYKHNHTSIAHNRIEVSHQIGKTQLTGNQCQNSSTDNIISRFF